MFNTITDLIGTPAILVGLFALLGLLLQKKDLADIISGTLKTIMGFIMINAGAGVIIDSLDVFGKMFHQAFNITGVIPNNEAILAVAQKTFGTQMALVLVFGMIINIILARFTPFKYIFLTGHNTLFMACVITVTLSVGGVSGPLLTLIGSLILGLCMVLSPAMINPYVKKVTDKDDFAVGHFGSIGYFVSGFVGKIFGNTSKSTEDIRVPKKLQFLQDGSVSISLTMAILFMVVASFAGPQYIEKELSNGTSFLVYTIVQAITFAVGVTIVINGVSMLIKEIIPAFKGIANKVVPNAVPALDCTTLFPYAPNAVIIGFITSFSAGVLSIFLLPLVGLPIIVPGLVPHFFTGATAAIIANATGGRRGALIGSFVNGLLISFLPALLIPLLGTLSSQPTTFGDTDYISIGLLIGYVMKLF